MISIADMVASGTATATKTYCKVILPCARKPTNRGQLPGAALPNARLPPKGRDQPRDRHLLLSGFGRAGVERRAVPRPRAGRGAGAVKPPGVWNVPGFVESGGPATMRRGPWPPCRVSGALGSALVGALSRAFQARADLGRLVLDAIPRRPCPGPPHV
jgi:hypothetical protein